MSRNGKQTIYFSISEASSIIVAAIGLFALSGWVFNVPFMKSILPGFVAIKVNTAICFMLSGISLWSLQTKRAGKLPFLLLGNLCALTVTAAGALTIFEYLSGQNLGIDQFFFEEPSDAIFTASPGRMALITAFNFLIVGAALFLFNIKRMGAHYLSQSLALIAGFMTFAALCGYFYGASNFYDGIAMYMAIALHTAVAFLFLCLGILFARPYDALSGVITARESGGLMMRRLMLILISVPVFMGWLKLLGERAGLYSGQFGTALMVVISIALVSAVFWWTAASVNRAEKKRDKIQRTLDSANEVWKLTFDSMSDLVFIVDTDNTVTNANSAFLHFLGKPAQDVVGKKCYQIMHGTNAPIGNCPLEKSKLDHKSHVEEVNDPHIGVPLLVTTSPITNKDGEIVGFVHAAKDISSVRNTESLLRETEEKYKVLYDTSSDAIMILDPAKGFVGGNQATIKLFDCDDEEHFMSFKPSDLSPERQPDGSLSLPKSKEMMALAFKNGSHLFEWKHKRLTGEEFFAFVQLTRMTYKGVALLQAVVRDISEQKKARKELEDKVEELERFRRITVDRELRMKELKARLARLESQLEER